MPKKIKWFDLDLRDSDSWGSGFFGAPRGNRTHNGIDLCVQPNTDICACIHGEVTKIGFPYGDDLNYRYVQITNGGYDFRIFYVRPKVKTGDVVTPKTVIGASQRLTKRYKNITEHIHLEIKKGNSYIDPTPLYLAMRDN